MLRMPYQVHPHTLTKSLRIRDMSAGDHLGVILLVAYWLASLGGDDACACCSGSVAQLTGGAGCASCTSGAGSTGRVTTSVNSSLV